MAFSHWCGNLCGFVKSLLYKRLYRPMECASFPRESHCVGGFQERGNLRLGLREIACFFTGEVRLSPAP